MEGLPDIAELALLCNAQRHIKNAKNFFEKQSRVKVFYSQNNKKH